MTLKGPSVLTLNGGSSSIKFALYQMGEPPKRALHGKVDRIGSSGTTFVFSDPAGKQMSDQNLDQSDRRSAAIFLFDWLESRVGLASIAAIGHRVVNGGPNYLEAQLVTDEMLDELRRISAYAPEHLPAEIDMIELISERVPDMPQVACFDTAFHRTMPRVAKILPIPRRLQAKGVERFGFHGLSYTFLMEELVA